MKALSHINDYLHDALPLRESFDFVNHIENCRKCYDELEVQFMVQKFTDSISENTIEDYELPKILKVKIKNTKKKYYRRYKTVFIAILLILIFVLGFVVYLFLTK